MTTHLKRTGAWSPDAPSSVNVGGVWKPTQSAWVKQAGVWRQVTPAGTLFQRPTTAWTEFFPVDTSSSGTSEYAAISPQFADHGGIIDTIEKRITYGGPDGNWVYGWEYNLMYKSANPSTFTGSLKVTNQTTGRALTLQRVSNLLWRLSLSNTSGSNYTADPNDNWIRKASATPAGGDTFFVQEA